MIFHDKSIKSTTALLKTDGKKGLSFEEVLCRYESFGYNILAEKKQTSIIVKFLGQFNDFMIIILLIAAGVSSFVSFSSGEGDYIDAFIILAIVVLNAILGVVQEYKAEKSLDALKKLSAPHARVIRDGEIEDIVAENLVPGDIVLIEAGDFIPADGRLIETHNLKIQESALTGESQPVEKDASNIFPEDAPIGDLINMVFASGTVTYGRGKFVVTATGMDTEVGKIAFLIMNDETPETPLQKKLGETGKILGIGALLICFIIFLLGISQNKDLFEMFMTSVSLAVAAIPEGLPAIVTIMLAIGVERMSRQNAIVRKLPAVETLGSATVICSDKTGTLTQNKMKVVEISDVNGIVSDESIKEIILRLGTLCNDAVYKVTKYGNEVIGDPTEAAIVYSAYEQHRFKDLTKKEMPRVDEVPFDSKRKLMTTVHSIRGGGFQVITKGAPDVLLSKCSFYYENGEIKPLTKRIQNKIEQVNTEMAEKALRVIGVAYKEKNVLPAKIVSETVENSLVFAGLIGMIDPPRKEVFEAVKSCKKAGIKPVMVTGDHIVTAKAIATKLNIMSNADMAITGYELENMSQEDLMKNIYRYSVFARVSPEHKVRIVKAFKARGAIVAMTGDGVNDAPALKAADIGCAMGITGTDVAKEAADMILTDDNFSTIVSAVKEGRGIYSNIKKAVHFLLSCNIGEIITIFVGIMLGWPTPLLAIQLLWVNLVTDSLPAIALGLDKPDKDIMSKKIITSQKSLFTRDFTTTIAVEGIMIGMLSLIAFGVGWIYYDMAGEAMVGRSMAFAVLSLSQLFHSFNMRSDKSLFEIDIFGNSYLVKAFIAGVILQVSVLTIKPISEVFKVTALNNIQWLIVFALAFMPIILVEIEKKLNLRKTEDAKERVYLDFGKNVN